MSQNVNKIIGNLSQEWAMQSMQDKRRIAVLIEENERLKTELEENKKDNSAE